MDDYSFLQDLLRDLAVDDRTGSRPSWCWPFPAMRGCSPGWCFSHRADMRAVEKIEAGSLLNDERIRELTRAEMCRIAAEWERARKARAQKLTGDTGRGAEAAVRVSTRRP